MTDQSRVEFEAWTATKGMALHLDRADSGLYLSRVTQNYMDCWVASRAAVVIDLSQTVALEAGYDSIHGNRYASLPDHFADLEADEVFALQRSCRVQQAIEALGLKVKP